MVDNTRARRLTQLERAKLLIKGDFYIFPSFGKTPGVPRYTKRDHEITQEERDAAIAEHEAKHGEAPVHVGATKDPTVVSKIFKLHPDAVWSIACGPSNLVVIDADQKDGGPEKIAAHFEKHGLPEGCVVVPTQSGGRHYYFNDPDGRFTNSAGALKTEYGCDVRGKGGQCVSPGSIREDGKTYGTKADLIALIRARMQGALPQLPDHIVELIGAKGEASQSVGETDIVPAITELENTDWPDHVDLFEPGIGAYDIESLKASNPEFAALYDNPTGDHSEDRWAIAQHLLRAFQMPVTHLAVFYEGWEGAGTQTGDGKGTGNYRLRDIAREWFMNKDLYDVAPSTDAMGAVVDPDELPDVPPRGLLSFAEDIARFTDPDHIIENMCSPGQLGMIHGASNVGKTFAVIHCGETVVEGDKWFSRNVDQSGVLYCFGEGGEGFKNRLAAYRSRHTGSKGMIVRDGIPNLGDKLARAIKELGKAIDEANAMYAEIGMKPVKLTFLDTFAKAIAGAQENDTAVVQPILNALRKLARDKGVCIILIHHSGKDTMLGARGSSAIIADMDFNLEILDHYEAKKRKLKGVNPGQLAIIAPKMRDANKSGMHLFKLEEIELGTNKWGNPITSMVVVPIMQSVGEALGAVTDDGDEPGSTADALTADQNRQDEEKRITLLAKVRAAMSEPGVSKVEGDKVLAPLAELERRLKVLSDLKKASGCNYARELKKLLFRGEPAERLDDGWLRYVPGTGNRRPSCLIFSPKL